VHTRFLKVNSIHDCIHNGLCKHGGTMDCVSVVVRQAHGFEFNPHGTHTCLFLSWLVDVVSSSLLVVSLLRCAGCGRLQPKLMIWASMVEEDDWYLSMCACGGVWHLKKTTSGREVIIWWHPKFTMSGREWMIWRLTKVWSHVSIWWCSHKSFIAMAILMQDDFGAKVGIFRLLWLGSSTRLINLCCFRLRSRMFWSLSKWEQLDDNKRRLYVNRHGCLQQAVTTSRMMASLVCNSVKRWCK
jgi:hypothetical protein